MYIITNSLNTFEVDVVDNLNVQVYVHIYFTYAT